MLSLSTRSGLSALSKAVPLANRPAEQGLRIYTRACPNPPTTQAQMQIAVGLSVSGSTAAVGSFRYMSKYLSKSATKRLPLTAKRAKKGFYKGNGATKEGYFGKGGRFIVDPEKRLELIVPDLTGFKLKPYVAQKAPRYPPELKWETSGSGPNTTLSATDAVVEKYIGRHIATIVFRDPQC